MSGTLKTYFSRLCKERYKKQQEKKHLFTWSCRYEFIPTCGMLATVCHPSWRCPNIYYSAVWMAGIMDLKIRETIRFEQPYHYLCCRNLSNISIAVITAVISMIY
jgi:hypothetical protein